MATARLLLQDGSFLLLQDGAKFLLQDSSVSAAITFIVANAPDECAPGVAQTIYAEMTDDNGTSVAFDTTPTIRLWRVTSAGARANEVSAVMTQVGATDVWSYDWTPPTAGNYSAWVFGKASTVAKIDTFNVSVRAKIDPLALGDSDILVSRF